MTFVQNTCVGTFLSRHLYNPLTTTHCVFMTPQRPLYAYYSLAANVRKSARRTGRDPEKHLTFKQGNRGKGVRNSPVSVKIMLYRILTYYTAPLSDTADAPEMLVRCPADTPDLNSKIYYPM